ncbi:MAG: DEAD/DEAH box helicase [Deltaproteobacteria bacterium]|nr:DEAD/DEAH box helicase [Deltaproteobacteria bacterium]
MTENQEPEEQLPRAEHPQFLTKIRFEEFNLPPEILAGLREAGFVYCTPIQAQTLPLTLAGQDVAGQAQTGTGKTAAFLVTIFARLLSLKERKPGFPYAFVVAPTRELALQIYEDARTLGRYTGLSLAQVVGGMDYQKQADVLREGADIVICTPGRILDYMKQGIFKPAEIKVLVIDEADRLFDLGFTRDMRAILRKLPHYEQRLSMLFSATLSYRVLALTYDFMNLPEFISISPEEITPEGIDQSLYHVASEERLPLLLGLLEREPWTRILIFHNTKAGVEALARRLRGNGLPAEGITGDLPQRTRLRLMDEFRKGKTNILVATDVASRGIHVEDISHVINYELPQDPENYAHRIGRTARAGKKGRAISFASEDSVYYLPPIEDMIGYKIPVVWPEENWFKPDRSGSQEEERRVRTAAPQRRRRDAPPKARKPPAVPEARGEEKEAGPVLWSAGKVVFSSKPGGIFGLAPEKKPAPVPETSSDEHHEGRKRRRRKWHSRKRGTRREEGSPAPAEDHG